MLAPDALLSTRYVISSLEEQVLLTSRLSQTGVRDLARAYVALTFSANYNCKSEPDKQNPRMDNADTSAVSVQVRLEPCFTYAHVSATSPSRPEKELHLSCSRKQLPCPERKCHTHPAASWPQGQDQARGMASRAQKEDFIPRGDATTSHADVAENPVALHLTPSALPVREVGNGTPVTCMIYIRSRPRIAGYTRSRRMTGSRAALGYEPRSFVSQYVRVGSGHKMQGGNEGDVLCNDLEVSIMRPMNRFGDAEFDCLVISIEHITTGLQSRCKRKQPGGSPDA